MDRPVLRDHDVAGLEVAVDQPRGVRGSQSVRRLCEDGEDLLPRAWALGEPVLEGAAVDELHGDEHAPLERARVVNGDDVRMRQLGHGLGFAQQARLGALRMDAGAVAPRMHELQRDLPIELGIVGGIDLTHAAAPHGREDRVTVAEESFPARGRGRRARIALLAANAPPPTPRAYLPPDGPGLASCRRSAGTAPSPGMTPNGQPTRQHPWT